MSLKDKNGFLLKKVQTAKYNAINQAMSPPLNEVREVLVILKTKGMSVAKMTDFLRRENFSYTKAQIRYYLTKNPISQFELSSVEP